MTIGLAYDVSQEVGVRLGCARVEPPRVEGIDANKLIALVRLLCVLLE